MRAESVAPCWTWPQSISAASSNATDGYCWALRKTSISKRSGSPRFWSSSNSPLQMGNPALVPGEADPQAGERRLRPAVFDDIEVDFVRHFCHSYQRLTALHSILKREHSALLE